MLPLLIAGLLKNLNVACVVIGEVKVLVAQLCLTLCDPMGCRVLGPWNSPGKNTSVDGQNPSNWKPFGSRSYGNCV